MKEYLENQGKEQEKNKTQGGEEIINRIGTLVILLYKHTIIMFH